MIETIESLATVMACSYPPYPRLADHLLDGGIILKFAESARVKIVLGRHVLLKKSCKIFNKLRIDGNFIKENLLKI